MIARCEIHGVDEDDEGAYRVCCECYHVWPTRGDFARDNAETYRQMEEFDDSQGAANPGFVGNRRPIPDPNDETICPLCTHDL